MEDVFQHFRPSERAFIEQVIGWKKEVEDQYAPKLTDFLDPRMSQIVHNIIGKNGDIQVSMTGLFDGAERQRALIYPDYFLPSEEDFNLVICQLSYPSKFVHLKHPDVLGALLSIGLERSKFGDIRVGPETVQFVVAKEVFEYVRLNLISVGQAKVEVGKLPTSDTLLPPDADWKEQSTTTSSLRLDTVIASVYPISRQKAAAFINGGKVKVNFALCEQVSFELQESDLISIRGLGRFIIQSIEGKTKKDKYRMKVGKMDRKS